jgi:hypothetical protein
MGALQPHERLGRTVLSSAAVLTICWLLTLATPAEAYIDPSAGGMLVQLLLAGTAGVAVLGRLFWTRIKRLFGVSDAAGVNETVEPPSDPPHDRV